MGKKYDFFGLKKWSKKWAGLLKIFNFPGDDKEEIFYTRLIALAYFHSEAEKLRKRLYFLIKADTTPNEMSRSRKLIIFTLIE